MTIVQHRPLSCLLLRSHKWKIFSTDDGSNRYEMCIKCGEERWQSSPPGTSYFTMNP